MDEKFANLLLDMDQAKADVEYLKSLYLKAGDVPESILELLHGFIDNIEQEITFSKPIPTGRAGYMIVQAGFRKGGKFNSCVSALRALG